MLLIQKGKALSNVFYQNIPNVQDLKAELEE